jgi:hypothetical protein
MTAPTCQQFLSACRKGARERKGWTDRACGVLDNGGDYFVVEDEHGEFVWEGKAHCRWCARAEAIGKMADAEYILNVDGRDTRPPYTGPEAAMLSAIHAYDAGGRVITLSRSTPVAATYRLQVDGGVAFAWIRQRKLYAIKR